MHVRRICVRAAALGVAVLTLVVLMRLMGPGTRAVAVGALAALVSLWGGSFTWSSNDAARSPAVRPVAICWLGVFAVLLGGYVVAARLFGGTEAQMIALPELVLAAAVPAALCVALPAALGIALGRRRRAQAARLIDQ